MFTNLLNSSELWVFSVLSLPLFLIGGVTIVYSVFGIGKGSLVLAIIVASFCGIVADHMLGNLAYWGIYKIPSSVFIFWLPVSVVERASLTAVATVFGVGLILALKRANLLTRKL